MPDALLDALSKEIVGTITGYVVVACYLDTEGDYRIWTDLLDDQRCHATLGLLDFAQAVERRRAADAWFDSD